MKTEIKSGTPQNPESASASERREKDIIWRGAFEAVQELAGITNMKVTRMSPTFKLDFNDKGVFHFRVNPALTYPDGTVKILVVDIGYEKNEDSGRITPAQQAVIEGIWKNGKVTNTKSDLSDINKTKWKLDETLIGRCVTGMIKAITASEKKKKNNQEQAQIEEPTPIVIAVPESYSTSIN